MTQTAETNIVDTLQSLTIAFALAMAVRSFVTEGFVIPTGSMAPTLLGAHVQFASPQTGYAYPFDAGPLAETNLNDVPRIYDPMLSTTQALFTASPKDLARQVRHGDRVLVLKYLYAFFEPKRWDVVVFKNPPDPVGDYQNYIKRLVGLPNEQLLLLDGDVWTAPLGAPLSDFKVQRKPEYVQRAVWQPVHDSDFIPIDPKTLATSSLGRFLFQGPPWVGEGWDLSGRAYRRDSAAPTTLAWDWRRMPIDDFCAYNILRPGIEYPVSDIRVAAAIEADDPATLQCELELAARSHLFVWMIKDGSVTLSARQAETGDLLGSVTQPIELPPAGRACDLEFWHVDQTMSLWLNGREIAHFEYDNWTPEERARFSRRGLTVKQIRDRPVDHTSVTPPALEWRFRGSPLTLHRVRVDRDLYYRPDILGPTNQLASNGPILQGLAFATDIDHPAQLKDDQFLMLGDNSAASRDGRLWGRTHPIVTKQLGESDPFIVPRDLLLGKAWCVYFPSPLPGYVPDFGSLRFIR